VGEARAAARRTRRPPDNQYMDIETHT